LLPVYDAEYTVNSVQINMEYSEAQSAETKQLLNNNRPKRIFSDVATEI